MSDKATLLAEPPPDDKTIPALVRAFIERRADFITIDGWTPMSQRADILWACRVGLLQCCEETSKANSDEQYTAICYRLCDPSTAALRAIANGGSDETPAK